MLTNLYGFLIVYNIMSTNLSRDKSQHGGWLCSCRNSRPPPPQIKLFILILIIIRRRRRIVIVVIIMIIAVCALRARPLNPRLAGLARAPYYHY